jgi:hypothetical protein
MLPDGFATPARDSPVNASFDVATRVKATPSSLDSPLEEREFEQLVPREASAFFSR